MNFHALFLSGVLILIALINLFHFINKRKKNKQEAQIYFIILFLIFIIGAIIRIIAIVNETTYIELNMGISVLFLSFLVVAGISLTNNLIWARIISIIFGLLTIIYFIGIILGYFQTWGIVDELMLFMNSLSGLLTILGLILLIYFYSKSRLSALFGLFMGILISAIVILLGAVVYPILTEHIPILYMLITINFIMFLGFKEKLNIFKKK